METSMPEANEFSTRTRRFWGIGRKLALSYAFLITLSLLISAVSLIGLHFLDRAVYQAVDVGGHISRLTDSLEISLLKARQMEKDFFLHYKETGMETARQQYVKTREQPLQAAYESALQIEQLLPGEQQRIQVAQIKALIAQYEHLFSEAVALYEAKGYKGSGLVGELGQAIQQVEDILTPRLTSPETTSLQILILELRQWEQDYLLCQEEQDIVMVHDLVREIGVEIDQSSLPAEEKSHLTEAVSAYAQAFDALAVVDLQIDSSRQSQGSTADAVVALADQIRTQALYDEQAVLDELARVANLVETGVIVGLVTSLVLGLGASIGISRSILSPIRQLTDTSRTIAAGDLEQQVHVQSSDETAILADAFEHMLARLRGMLQNEQERRIHLQATVQQYVDFMTEVAQGHLSARLPLGEAAPTDDPLQRLGSNLNHTVASLQQMIEQIHESADNLRSAAAEIFAATTRQASGAAEQSSAIAQASTTIREVHAIAEQTAQRAQAVADLARQTVQVAQGGQYAVEEAIGGVSLVKTQVESIAGNVLALSERAQAIGGIIGIVNDIATQSSMLALNAAVEAARAGRAGAGFAVVAQEVRALAQQSHEATEGVRGLLTEVQCGINSAVMSTEEGAKGTEATIRLAREAGAAIGQLAESVTTSTRAALEITTAASEQQAGMEQIALAMEQIHEVTGQSVSGARHVEQAAQELSNLADRLYDLIEQYVP